MSKFKQRSKELELMDGETEWAILEQNYAEIERVNQYLGGNATLLKGLGLLLDNQRPYTILDVGCGSGDAIAAMLKWAAKNGCQLHIIGLDYSETACALAQKRFMGLIAWKLYAQIMLLMNPQKPLTLFAAICLTII